MRIVRLRLLILRLGVAICIALGRARRKDWLGALAQTMAMAIEKTMTFFCVWLRSAAALARRLLGATRAVVARPATWRISCVVAAPPRCSSALSSTGS
mgnify:CR=1 FL=1